MKEAQTEYDSPVKLNQTGRDNKSSKRTKAKPKYKLFFEAKFENLFDSQMRNFS